MPLPRWPKSPIGCRDTGLITAPNTLSYCSNANTCRCYAASSSAQAHFQVLHPHAAGRELRACGGAGVGAPDAGAHQAEGGAGQAEGIRAAQGPAPAGGDGSRGHLEQQGAPRDCFLREGLGFDFKF